MAEKIIAASLKLDSGQAETSVKNFKTQLKDANNELLQMSDKFGATSREAVNAAKKVAGLKDAIGDAKGLADAFNPDKKFAAFSNAISGVVGGFSGLTGAMALFGGQSKEVEQTLLKVQAAMALSQGVNSILNSKDAFIALGAKIKDIGIFQKANALANQLATGTMKAFGVSVETSSTAFKVLKGAIAATGIGLLVVAIGEAVSAFQSFQGAADRAKEAQVKFNEAVQEGADISLKTETEFLKRQTDIDVARAKLAGATEKEIFDIQTNGLKNKADALTRHYNEIKDIDTKAAIEAKIADKAALDDIQNQFTLSKINFEQQEKNRAEAAAKNAKDAADKASKERTARLKQEEEDRLKLVAFNLETQKKEHDQQLAEVAQFQKEDDDQKAALAKRAFDNEKTRLEAKKSLAELGLIDNPDSGTAKIDKLKADLELELSTLAEGDLQRQVLTRQSEEAITQIEKEESEKRKKEKQAEADAKLEIQNAELNTLGEFGNLLQQLGTKHKAIAAAGVIVENAAAIAKIIVNTNVANAKAIAISPLTLGQPWVTINSISGALGVAASLLATKNALSHLGGGSGGSAPLINASATNSAAPLRPEAPTATSTTLDAASLNKINNATVRAYVVDADVQNNRERDTRLSRAARLGG